MSTENLDSQQPVGGTKTVAFRVSPEEDAQIETFVQTNNAVANAIINSKLTTAYSLGIKVSCITVADFSGIDETDLCDLHHQIF